MIKKILLIGDANHQFVTNYSFWIRKNNFAVDILSLSTVKKENRNYYDKIYDIKKSTFFYIVSKIKGFRRFFRLFSYNKILKKIPSYDFIHVHYISNYTYYLINQIKKQSNSRIILSIWGSDLYRLNPNKLEGFKRTCLQADSITFTNEKSIDYFIDKFNWKRNNLKLCRFGLSPLQEIDKLKLSKLECKQKLAWNENKFAITIGYNLSPAQQHLEILKQIRDDEIKKFKDKVQFIIPITYGGSKKYKENIIKELQKSQFEYFVYDSFLSDERIALIRKASDIMIQLQISDQFSGSMQEHLYTENIVITGSWLPYDTLKDNGVNFIEISNINELVKVIPEVLNNYHDYLGKNKKNPKAIKKLSSWESNISNWLDLYKV